MDTIQFVVTPETLEKLKQSRNWKILSVGDFRFIQKKLVTLDLTSLPVINKKYVDQSMSTRHPCEYRGSAEA